MASAVAAAGAGKQEEVDEEPYTPEELLDIEDLEDLLGATDYTYPVDKYAVERANAGQCTSGAQGGACKACASMCTHHPCLFDPLGFARWVVSQLEERHEEVTEDNFRALVTEMAPRLAFDTWHGTETAMVRFRMTRERPGARVSMKPGSSPCSMLGPNGCTLNPKMRPIEGITAFACRHDVMEVGKKALRDDWSTPLGEMLSWMVAVIHRTMSSDDVAAELARAEAARIPTRKKKASKLKRQQERERLQAAAAVPAAAAHGAGATTGTAGASSAGAGAGAAAVGVDA